MKKLITIILFSTFFSTSFAQTWIDNGATWHYQWLQIAGVRGFYKIEYKKDTLIEQKLCQQLTAYRYLFFPTVSEPLHFGGVDTLDSYYTYVNGDTVFKYNGNHFNQLFNFGAQPGDSWVVDDDSLGLNCGPSTVIVNSVGTIVINNNTYRWIKLNSLDGSSLAFNGQIVERFGTLDDYLFGHQQNCDSNINADFPLNDFSCFEDQSFPLYNPSGHDCEYPLNLNVYEIIKNHISIFPNPCLNNIWISLNSETSIKSYSVIDINGREVIKSSSKISFAEIDMSKLEKGIYFIRILTNQDELVNEKIIKM